MSHQHDTPDTRTEGPPPSASGHSDTGGRPDTSNRGHPDGSADTSARQHPGGHPGGRDYAEAPLVVTWEVSQACALTCDHCRADANPDRHPDELSMSEARDLFESVASFSPSPFLVLSGGDPLERPDIFELLETAVDAGVTPSITPATTDRLTRDVIERFADIGVGRMALSLDGATASSHDGFRGEPGTFARTIEAAEHARDCGVPIQFNTTVTARTASELPEIATLVSEYDAAMWEVFFLVPVGRGAELAQLSPGSAREVMTWLYEHSREAPYRVITVEAPFYRRVASELGASGHVGSTGAGNGFVFVSHTGEVYPSGFLPLPVGNVRETPLPELYREAPLMQRLRDRESFDGPCGNCPMTSTCGGSRSRAYAATGNPFGSDPLCPWADQMTQATADD